MKNDSDKKVPTSSVGKFFYNVFVRNIGWKLFAIVFGALVWCLIVAL